MVNYFYKYNVNNETVVAAVSIAHIPELTFSMVKNGVIIPLLTKNGVKGYNRLTYARAKYLPNVVPIPANSITPILNINGVNYNTLTGEVLTAEQVATSPANDIYAMVKESFSTWLIDQKLTKRPVIYLSSIDKASDYLIKSKISLIDLWQYTDYKQFKSMYNIAIQDKSFREIEEYPSFVYSGEIFYKFLKDKSDKKCVPTVPVKSISPQFARLTIKEAIMSVLETEKNGLTVEQIYNKIITYGLFSFGAKNPRNVVQVEIENLCENSKGNIRTSQNCFSYEINWKGEKVYFLTLKTSIKDALQKNVVNNLHVSLASVPMRGEFNEWLTKGNAREYSPEVTLACIDRMSEYAFRKKISAESFWGYTNYDDFKPVYYRLIESKLFRLTERNTHKVFIVAGQLYLDFLNEKISTHKECIDVFVAKKEVESVIVPEPSSQNVIDPENVIAWLVKQPNANGTLYLETVVRQYMSVLRSAPAKLETPVTLNDGGIFACHTPEELTSYWDIFKAAPNYKQVNSTTSGMFSAGMGCLLRYLEHLSETTLTADKRDESDVIWLVRGLKLKYMDKRSSGGALWVIGGRELTDAMSKLRSSGFHFLYKAGGGKSSDYRDAWWYKPAYNANQSKPKELQVTLPINVEVSASPSKILRVDFSCPERCAQTRPLTCTIKGQRVVPSKQNWSQLLVEITEHFIANGNLNITGLERKSIYGSKMFFLPSKTDFGSCSQLSNGKWIYTNYNPQTVVTIIRNLCQHLGVDLDDVVITYEPKYDAHMQLAQTYSNPTYVAPMVMPKTPLQPAIIEKITGILSAHFANGYRLNSPIELARFRSFAAEDFGDEISLADEELKRYILACGTTYEGKVYAVSTETKERIKELAEEYLSDGAQAIFYSEFYAKNENWLFSASVISEDMLIGIIRRLFPKLSFTQTYFGYTDDSVFASLEREILRVWGDFVLLTYEQLAERLQYIPIERIKYALGQNGNFIWNSMETFSHVSKIDITDEEGEAIRNAVVQQCNDRGYASITDLPFGEIKERNYELSITAIHDAIFRICLSDKFDRSDKIITRKGDTLDALTIMKDYCRTIEKCSINDLLNYEKELTGEDRLWIAVEAGNSVLVRIEKETYVTDRLVHFDTITVDAAIELFVDEDYLPLKSFTTFGAFPECGQTWNLFLLESYCRRFSKKFRFDTLTVNSRNAGAVIRKSCGLNYTEIMADAVVNADVPLTNIAVGNFLFDSGYTGRSSTSKVNEIIDKAKAMQERRD